MIRKIFRKYVYFFLPEYVKGTKKILSQHKLFLSICLVTSCFAALYFFMSVYIEFTVGQILMAASALFPIVISQLLKKIIPIQLAANLSIGFIGIVFIILSYNSGGILHGPMGPWLLLLPLLAMLLLDEKKAVAWLLMSLVIASGFIVFELFGKKFPVSYLAEYSNIFNALSLIGNIFIIFLIVTVFRSDEMDAVNYLEKRNAELHEAMHQLKETQLHLVHAEKMAAVGQLASGIAHEIQNPLNYINNFSELSVELLQDLKSATTSEEKEETLEALKTNLERIYGYAKRSDKIVRAMHQLGQTTFAKKQLANVNRICDYALKRIYRDLHISLQEFKCSVIKNFDDQMPEIEINSNNLSRALYNLIDNSFYAVQEKYRLISENKLITGEKISTLGSDNSIKAFKTKLLGGTNGYSPQIKITTRMVDRGVEICIADNGLGIDKNILDKIFNPFFTTKPLGEGTGLGLSISYEIIKAHNGELHVETRAGDFSEFKIKLPAKHIHDPV